jgi:hypothetical protein
MWHVRKREMHTGFWSGKLKERDCFKDISENGMIILKRNLIRQAWMAWTELV